MKDTQEASAFGWYEKALLTVGHALKPGRDRAQRKVKSAFRRAPFLLARSLERARKDRQG